MMKEICKSLGWGLIVCAGIAVPAMAVAQASGNPSRVAVTDMAYTRNVAQYFEAGTVKSSGSVNVNQNGLSATQQSSGTYAAGTYSYLEQRELGSFANDIRGAILKGGAFRLVQGKRFDDGGPQVTKAEQVLNQIQKGTTPKPPLRQPEVHDIIARIKKGEFPGADYVLFGTLSSLEFRDQISPLQGTSSSSYQFSLDLVADFSLINTRTYEIKAAFSAQGAGNDTKLLSNRGDIVRPNRGQVMRDTSQSLAANVYQQLADQLGLPQLPDATPRVSPSKVPTSGVEATTTLR